jgi:hypothetical protein
MIESAGLEPNGRARSAKGPVLFGLPLGKEKNGAGWACMAQANPQIKNSNLIFAGQTLAIVGPLLALQLRAERAVRRGRAGPHEERVKSRPAPRLRPGVGT